LDAQDGSLGTNTSDRTRIEIRNAIADLKQVAETRGAYVPTYKEDVIGGLRVHNPMDKNVKDIEAEMNGLEVTASRNDSRGEGGTTNVLNTLGAVALAARDYISENPSASDKGNKQAYLDAANKKIASYIKKMAPRDSNVSLWLAEVAGQDIADNTDVLKSYGLSNIQGLLNDGAELNLMKTLRGVRFMGGMKEVDINEIMTDPKYARYQGNIKMSLDVLKTHNDDSKFLTDIVDRINQEIDPSFNKDKAGGMMKTRTETVQDVDFSKREQLVKNYSSLYTAIDPLGDMKENDSFDDIGHFEEKYLKSEESMDDVDYSLIGGTITNLTSAFTDSEAKTIKSRVAEQVESRTDNFRKNVLPTLNTQADLERMIDLAKGAQANLAKEKPSKFNDSYLKINVRKQTLVDYINMGKFKLKQLSNPDRYDKSIQAIKDRNVGNRDKYRKEVDEFKEQYKGRFNR